MRFVPGGNRNHIAAGERLHALTPDPKSIVFLDGGHIDGRRPELNVRIGEIARSWLAEKGALND